MAGFIELEDAKLHLRLDGTDEDGELERLIEASAAFIAANYGVVPAQDLHLQLDGFRPNIRIPCRPVDIETIVVTYVDPVGDEKQFDDYRTFTRDGWTWLQPKVGKAWPSFAPVEGAVTISATCGYSESDAPADLVHASRLLVDHWYNNRDGINLPPAIANLLDHYRFRRV